MVELGTKFGAMLDMLTDRCATMCLLATLGTFYPSYLFFFQLVMVVDISCHWIHLHTSVISGKTSHKNIAVEENALLHFYYTSRPFLFFMCMGNELFYSLLYLLHFTYGYTCKSLLLFYPSHLIKIFYFLSFGHEHYQGVGSSALSSGYPKVGSGHHARRFCMAQTWLHRH